MEAKHLYLPAALTAPVMYVGSLYILDRDQFHSDHPVTIKKRFIGVAASTTITVMSTYILLYQDFKTPHTVMGLYANLDTLEKCLHSFILTSSIYLGTFYMEILDGTWGFYSAFSPFEWLACLKDLVWLRNNVIAPITEELVFRGCAAVLIQHSLGKPCALFFSPLLFAISHYHHLRNDINHGSTVTQALLTRTFQATYTYLFGGYATFLTQQYGQILPTILSHALCNSMGLPRVWDLMDYPKKHRFFIVVANMAGLAGFAYGVYRMI
ncbi:unnamed protein product [Bursaphelenchus okinawaensis]|uniref:CAAX prenyl protease 2 n=1 Tax=Bursaphelenchus okinawaensis TaxID=465554 RepID=A0A811L3W9_9BILA|nr:unnamed protein product [Bursaphelenchus okinawaensis]CAG9116839.1 unnamed protein product [Bursaphelenchus okinawaensis]